MPQSNLIRIIRDQDNRSEIQETTNKRLGCINKSPCELGSHTSCSGFLSITKRLTSPRVATLV